MVRKNIGVVLLPTLVDALSELASTDDQGRTRNQLIEEACRQFVTRERARRRRSQGEFAAGMERGGDSTPLVSGDTKI